MQKHIEKFNNEVVPALKKELQKSNIMEVPKLSKIVVSAGIGDYKEDKGAVEKIAAEITRIAGQKSKINLSRKSVSAFKLRVGQPVGISVTLRKERMHDFLVKLVNIALPRVRDFKGVSAGAFDGNGNYSIGIRDYTIFPEVKYEDVDKTFGLQINFKTTAKNDEDARALLVALGVPFEKK
ncbi:MAG: 50S ribosomal protein L5 [bacterium]